MTYNIPIPEPKASLQKVAHLFSGSSDIEVFWQNRTAQVIFCVKNNRPEDSGWFIQNNGNIIDSLCYFLPFHYFQFVVTNLFLFEDQTLEKGTSADDLITDIYDCDWSDFGYDKLVLHMGVQGCNHLQNEEQRLEYVARIYGKNDTRCPCGYGVKTDHLRSGEPSCSECASTLPPTCTCAISRIVRSTDKDRVPQVSKYCENMTCKLPLTPWKHAILLSEWQQKVIPSLDVKCRCGKSRPVQTISPGDIRCVYCWVKLA
jgi:hypothetical protein